MQFHPTVLYIAGSSRSLITEAMRGEGAYLVDRNGYRFMPDYDTRGELAPRDVVSQAIVSQMEKTRHPNVYLDLSHLDPDYVRGRFPGIAATCAKFGMDITRDQIPVRPGAHYMIGGVTVDLEGRTTVPGLWAAGEVTSTGLHGANRLASNSLLEGLVYGAHAGQGASRAAAQMPDDYRGLPLENPPVEDPTEPLDLPDIRNSLKSLMWRSGGVRRSRQELSDALDSIDTWQRLRAGPPVLRTGRLGAAEHADHRPGGRRRGPGTGGIPRRAPPHRLPRAGQRTLAAALVLPARPQP